MDRMRKICLSIAFGLAVATITANGQITAPAPDPTPSFAGTWKYVRTESAVEIDVFSAGPNKWTNQRTNQWANQWTNKYYFHLRNELIEISQNGDEIRFRHTFTTEGKTTVIEKVYYTDGRGEKNPVMAGSEVVSAATIKGRKLKIEGRVRSTRSSEKDRVTSKNEWTLSSDNNTLRFIIRPLIWSSEEILGTTFVYKRQ